MKTYTLNQGQDQLIGKVGSPARDTFEYDFQLEMIGAAIKNSRKQRRLTQEELGRLIGVQKAQISRLENNPGNVTIETLIHIFNALNANLQLRVELSLG